MKCWVVTDGGAGMENQALGLAEALQADIVTKRIVQRFPWNKLAPYLKFGRRWCVSPQGDQLQAPWPDLIIASGRQAILPSLHIKKQSRGHTKVIYLQNPVIAIKQFDAIVCPEHDQIVGAHVVKTLGATHRVTNEKLAEELEKFPQWQTLTSPKIAVMLGGPSRAYQFSLKEAEEIADTLLILQQKYQATLLVTPSRRTDKEVIAYLKTRLAGSQTLFWDGEGANPYFAYLALADAILVTCDSVCMISEACFTTKPVYLIPLPGQHRKFEVFHQAMLAKDRVSWLDQNVEFKEHVSFNENADIANKIRNILKL